MHLNVNEAHSREQKVGKSMKYKWTVNKVKLYKLVRDNWPGWYEIPQFRRCDFTHLGARSFWLRAAGLEVYLTVCAGGILLTIEDAAFGRLVFHPSAADLLDRFMIKVVA